MKIQDTASEYPRARILVVDDHEASVQTIQRVLRKAGYENVTTTSDSRRVLVLLKELKPDLLLLDIRMPQLDGFAVLRQIRSRDGQGFLPVLVITGDADTAVKEQALSSGANDFLQKPFDTTEIALRVRNLLKLRFLTADLEARVAERTAALKRSEMEVAQRLALAAELRDYKSGDHTRRVGETSALIADALGLHHEQVEAIRLSAPLHDIGKIGIPDSILLKRGPLTLDEFEVVKGHTSFGARILAGSASVILQQAEEIALYHHENWDGTGYTPGLEGTMIPISARIVRVADAYDALVHERPYQDARAADDAVDLIAEGAGTTFDPDVVDAFVQVQSTHGLPLLSDDPQVIALPTAGPDELARLMRNLEPTHEQRVIGSAG